MNNKEYGVNSEFDADRHSETFVNYLEIVIDKDGKIMYALPSHIEKMISLACDKLHVDRDELNKMCPVEYYFDFITWLSKISGACSVWKDMVIGYKFTKKQIEALEMLKEKQLYFGVIPSVTAVDGD